MNKLGAGLILGVGLLAATGALAAVSGGASIDVPGFGLNNSTDNEMNNPNVKAFALAVRAFESGTGPSAYYMLNGGGSCATLADHPANLEWAGRRLSDAQCKAAGYGSGCVSTAAGAYQIIKPTWNRVAKSLGLVDFSEDSQDAAFVKLLSDCNALADVKAGNVVAAINKCASQWASMPGNTKGQKQASLSQWVAAYQRQGGAVA